MENSGNMFLAELVGRAKQLLNGMAAEQNLPLVEIVRRVNVMSQVVTLLTDVAGRNNDDVRDQPPAAISQQPVPVVLLPKMKLGKNKPEAEPAMPRPLTFKSESESESESSSSEDEATPPKKARSGRKSTESVDGTGKEFQCRSCKQILSTRLNLKLHILNKHTGKTDKPHSCKFTGCGKRFGAKHAMIRHYRAHIDQFACAICSRVFTRKDILASHIKKVHKKERS